MVIPSTQSRTADQQPPRGITIAGVRRCFAASHSSPPFRTLLAPPRVTPLESVAPLLDRWLLKGRGLLCSEPYAPPSNGGRRTRCSHRHLSVNIHGSRVT